MHYVYLSSRGEVIDAENLDSAVKAIVRASKMLIPLIEEGYEESYFLYAQCHETLLNIEQRYDIGMSSDVTSECLKRMLEYYKKSADSGNIDAMYSYADSVSLHNPEEAAIYYGNAASNNHSRAKLKYAICLSEGRGVKKDQNTAGEIYMEIASNLEHVTGNNILKSRALYENAYRCLKEASELGDVNATYNLASCYERGKGCIRNIKTALSYYQDAADKGHSASRSKLVDKSSENLHIRKSRPTHYMPDKYIKGSLHKRSLSEGSGHKTRYRPSSRTSMHVSF